jgi:hypothetical protein
MDALKEFVGLDGLTNDDLVSAATDILCTGDIIHGFKNPQSVPLGREVSNQEASEAVIKNPTLAFSIVLSARLERMHYDYLESQKTTHLLLQDVIESIDCAGTKAPLADEVKLTALSSEQALEALIICWHGLNPNCNDRTMSEFHEAVAEFKRLVGL